MVVRGSFFAEDRMLVAAVLLIFVAIMDRAAARAAETHDAGLFDPGGNAVDQGNGAARAAVFAGVAAHALIVDPEFVRLSPKSAGIDRVGGSEDGADGRI